MASTSTEMQNVQYVHGENSEGIIVHLLNGILFSSWYNGSTHLRLFHYFSIELVVLSWSLSAFLPPTSPGIPKTPISTEGFHVISVIAAEGLLIIRTLAFWNCNKKLLAFLLVFAAPATVADLSEDGTYACVFQSARTNAIQYGFLIMYEIVLMSLTIYRRLRYYRNTNNPLVLKLYGDGLVYMTLILVTSFFNFIINLPVIPATFTGLLDVPQVVLHSILASRIHFNLRETAGQGITAQSLAPGGSTPLEQMVFAVGVTRTSATDEGACINSRMETLHNSGSGGGPLEDTVLTRLEIKPPTP
ncbi:hypothetical protein BU15DRAFT_60112 [Melanogaster broomeanus]|nr:hypothetical protein BU15DRAFT_60112 [Melanogaster broomeanus]